MKRLWLLPIVALLLFASCKKQPAVGRAGAVTEAELIGDWTTLKGDAEYVTFAKADGEYFYGAYLRGRPLYTGTWKLEQGKLTIIADNGTKTIYDMVVIKEGILDLDNGAERYERLVVKTGEDMVKELLDEAAKAAAVGFTPVKAVEMAWNRQQDRGGRDPQPQGLADERGDQGQGGLYGTQRTGGEDRLLFHGR